MGCGESKLMTVYNRPEVRAKKEIYEAFSFSTLDIGRLHKVYRKIDNDDSNSIELAELLAFLDLDRTRFTKRIFTMFDEDGSGLLDFHEFVLSLWNYCTLTKSSLVLFAFDLYDKDNSGTITNNEVMDMLKDLYGKDGYKRNPQAKLIAVELEALERLDGDVDIEDFREFCRTHPALLFLAFQMQESIHNRVLGPTFWRAYSEKRIEISSGRLYVPVFEFMEIYVNPKLRHALDTQTVGMGKPIPKRDIGHVPQPKLDGRVSRKTKIILENTGPAYIRNKGLRNGTAMEGIGDMDQQEAAAYQDKLNVIKDVYQGEAVEKHAEAIAKNNRLRRGSVMPTATATASGGPDTDLAAGMKASKKGRRQSMRRSFDSIASAKSKELYSNHNMITPVDSHIHSVSKALEASKKLMDQNMQDPDKHARIMEEFNSFSSIQGQHQQQYQAIPGEPQQQKHHHDDELQPPPRDNAAQRRQSVAVPSQALVAKKKRMSQRRSFDGVPMKKL
jgi:Ca2+-binding EF-hand superfamily protein